MTVLSASRAATSSMPRTKVHLRALIIRALTCLGPTGSPSRVRDSVHSYAQDRPTHFGSHILQARSTVPRRDHSTDHHARGHPRNRIGLKPLACGLCRLRHIQENSGPFIRSVLSSRRVSYSQHHDHASLGPSAGLEVFSYQCSSLRQRVLRSTREATRTTAKTRNTNL